MFGFGGQTQGWICSRFDIGIARNEKFVVQNLLQVHSKPKFCHRPKNGAKIQNYVHTKTYSRHVVVVLEIQPVACVLPLKKGTC